VPAFVIVAVRLPPLHVLGMLVRITEVTVPLEIAKFVTTPDRFPQVATAAVPDTKLLGVTEVVLASARPGSVATIPASTTHAFRRNLIVHIRDVGGPA
jgi:hypothetical protein